eukprot:3448369-Pleurochrysis_carterae.AAC.1
MHKVSHKGRSVEAVAEDSNHERSLDSPPLAAFWRITGRTRAPRPWRIVVSALVKGAAAMRRVAALVAATVWW